MKVESVTVRSSVATAPPCVPGPPVRLSSAVTWSSANGGQRSVPPPSPAGAPSRYQLVLAVLPVKAARVAVIEVSLRTAPPPRRPWYAALPDSVLSRIVTGSADRQHAAVLVAGGPVGGVVGCGAVHGGVAGGLHAVEEHGRGGRRRLGDGAAPCRAG